MPELAERLLRIVRKQEFLRAGDRVAVAVSGGADSVALLLLLLEVRSELGIALSIAHVNHKLRGAESDEDERFVAGLATEHGLELSACAAPVEHARGTGIESAARKLRYEFFRQLVDQGPVSQARATNSPATNPRVTKVATAHTLDDQAETVLLRMFRGTGIRGLAGILPRLRLPAPNPQSPERSSLRNARRLLDTQRRVLATGYWPLGTDCVVRPLLGFRRAELREYLRERSQSWREDSSNQDSAFLRNRLRQRLMPLIAGEFGEAAIEHIAELAEIARAEEDHWAAHPLSPSAPGARLAFDKQPADKLLALPLAAARRTIRAWIEQNAPAARVSFRLIEEILDLARGPAGRKIELPGSSALATDAPIEAAEAGDESALFHANKARSVSRLHVARVRADLVLETSSSEAEDYEYTLPVPGEVFIPELGVCIAAEEADVASEPEKNRSELLDPTRLGSELIIRNWRPGDRFWPAHTRQEKKVKELLSDRHSTGSEKKRWPVAVCRGELVWVRGFAAPKAWLSRSGHAIRIRETKTAG